MRPKTTTPVSPSAATKSAKRKMARQYQATYYRTIIKPFLLKRQRDRLKKKFADLGIPWEEGGLGDTG